MLAEFHLVPMDAGYFLDSILAVSILAFLAEIPLGRYRKRA
jgi:multisubunit Na+/H+ antiporter MnhF subunit